MTPDPVVTIVIPTYNHAGFLAEALASVRDQTYTDWEAIVVDNHSEDDTVAVVESFQDSRIRLETFKNNGIIGASRNRAMALARGEFIAFLDSDDVWLPRKLERCVTRFVPSVGLVAHNLERFGRASGLIQCGPELRASFDALLLEGSCITPSATMIRTDVLRAVGGFSEARDVATAEDYHLWLKLAAWRVKMEFLPEVLSRYRVHSASQSSAAIRHMNAVARVVDEFSQHPASKVPIGGLGLRRRRSLLAYGAARTMQASGSHHEAWPLYLSALRQYPFFPKTYAGIAMNGYAQLRTLFRRAPSGGTST
jgi:glycosyltransferase involved in cell wall biosynthesis